MRSWKTTAVGVLAILAALAPAIKAAIDGDPDTNADWNSVAAAIGAGFGLIFARDNDRTSEEVGADGAMSKRERRRQMKGVYPILLLPLLFSLLLLVGCSTGQQGQGPSRLANVFGFYIETPTGDQPDRVAIEMPGEVDEIDQSNTYQPAADGTAEATNTPDVSPNVEIPLTP